MGQIIQWGRGVWGLKRDGRPKELPVYINGTRNLLKYSKFDNFYQRTEEKYQQKKYRCVTQTDGSVIKIALSQQNLERQARILDKEFKMKYDTRLKKNQNLWRFI